MQRKLRAHHLLCMALYEGRGYSEEFCRNMEEVLEYLNDGNTEMQIVKEPDIICSACPNLTKERTCRGDANRVVDKDEYLIKALGLDEDKIYKAGYLKTLAKERMTEYIFDQACSTCQWKAQGLCSYEKLRLRMNLSP